MSVERSSAVAQFGTNSFAEPRPGFFGPRTPTGYSLQITTGDGDRIEITDLTSLEVTRQHTAISSWSATVPTQPGLDRRVLSSIRLFWGDTVLFNGRLEDLQGKLGEPAITISGPGIEADLTRGNLSLDFRNVPFWEAIRTVWRQHTDFDATVTPPESADHPANARIGSNGNGDSEYSGTPMSVLKSLHEDCGMRFTVLHSLPGRRVESYPIGTRKRRHDWDVLDGKRDMSAKGYANRVVVVGKLKYNGAGERYRYVAEDADEIAAMRKRGVGNDGVVTYPIGPDDQYDSREKAKAKAESKLDDLVDKDTVGGSLDISPTVAAPGYQYAVPEFGADVRPYGDGEYGRGTYGQPESQFVSLNKIQYSIGLGKRSCTLDFSQRDGFVGVVQDMFKEETSA